MIEFMRAPIRNYILLAILGLSTSLLVNIFVFKKRLDIKKRPIPPAPELSYAHMGFGPLLADTYWLRLIQDLDYCGEEASSPFEASLTPEGARRGPNRTPGCKKGWGYYMLNLIFALDPRFHYAYQLGPMSLSVITDDIEGATLLFEKATKEFPNDWSLHYQAGYHYMIELEEHETAIKHFQRAVLLGAPRWLPILIAKLQTKTGQDWLAKATLKNYIETVKDDPKLLKRAKEKLKDIK